MKDVSPTLTDDHLERLPIPGALTALAELPTQAMITQTVLAKLLGKTTRTIRRMVARFELPPGMKMGRELAWLVGDILAWWAKRAASKRQAVAAYAKQAWEYEK